jgi:hypothetical protein
MAKATPEQMIQETLAKVKNIEAMLKKALEEPAPADDGITLEADSQGGLLAKLKKTIRF